MILISAGHYPQKPGACHNGFCEWDEANRWVKEILSYIPTSEIAEVPTGFLYEKVKFINAIQPKLAIEIHFNSARIERDLNNDGIITEDEILNVGNGSLTLYYPGSNKGKQYAEILQQPMESVFGKYWDGVMEGWYKMNKKYGADYFLAKTKCPSVILEPEFIHKKDLIISKREAICYNIAQVLKEL